MPDTIQRSFTGGEISPALHSRADINKYHSALAQLDNMFVRTQGGAYSREGTRFVSEIGNSDKRARLIPFSFNTEQTYVLVFEENTMRVVTNGGLVLENDAITIYELATPYLESELSRLAFTQRADVMTLVHPSHEPRNLSRLADNDWSLDAIDFSPRIEPPVMSNTTGWIISNITQANPAVVTTTTTGGVDNNDFVTGDTVTITGVLGMTEVNDVSYTITVLTPTTFELNETDSTGYAAYISSGSASGRALTALGEGGGDYRKTYEYVVTAVDGAGEESVASLPQSLDASSLSTTFYMRIVWRVVSTATYYRIYKAPANGTGVYGFIGTSKTTKFEDYNLAPITSDAPPELRDPFNSISGNITGLNTTNSTEFTAVDHGLTSGETVFIDGIDQPTDFNGQYFPIEVVNKDTFIIINDIIGPFQPYTSGGTYLREGQRPATVNYYQQRLAFANTNEQRQTVFTSQTGNFDSLRTSTPTRADDAVTFSIAGREVNEIRHIVELDAMMLLTSGGVWRVTEGQDMVLTPATVGIRKQSNKGASYVAPVISDSTIIYAQSAGTRIRDFVPVPEATRSQGDDLSVMAQHLFDGYQIEEMTLADEPYSILWVVRSDGTLLGLTYQRQQEVWGWHQHTTNGTFESVTSVREGDRDAVYFVVNRSINGVTKRYIERMEARDVSSAENAWCVDSGLRYEGVPATVISGLDHLEGEDVAVVADGNVVADMTVESGAITLPREASKVTVGLGYVCTMDTLDLDTGQLAQTLKTRNISINEVMIELIDSRGVSAGAIKDDGTASMQEIKPRYDSFGYGAIPLTSLKERVTMDPSWTLGGRTRIQQTNPMPMAVLSVIPNVDIS